MSRDIEAPSLERARVALTEACIATRRGHIHTVTFQPTPNKVNEDRCIVQEWDDISGPPWLFLAVLDGHGSEHAAEYTAQHLPESIRAGLRSKVSREGAQALDARYVKNSIIHRIKSFDEKLGKAVKELCPDPSDLTEAEAEALVKGPNAAVFQRAYAGTTICAALIDGEKNNMWVVGLGDSSAVLSKVTPEGVRSSERLITLHNGNTPTEYARIALKHPSNEQQIMLNNRVLGGLSVTRAIGDFPFKLPPDYTKQIFHRLPSNASPESKHGVIHYNHTPPYVTPSSQARHFDLTTLRDQSPTLLLFTDGVDNIINGQFLFRKERPCKENPATVMGALLGDSVDDDFMQGVFDYKVEPGWNGAGGSKAVELLGNILAGKDASRLTQVLDPEYLNQWEDDPRPLYIDDTTIVVCPLF
ncbi:protein serine/threonine phosphatase 2C [Lyophyllum atratum]|nr:protein serine/threonine phosphatase 2C [Lyophyllum atratum]